MTSRAAHGYGLLTLHGDTVLDAWFPAPSLGEASAAEEPKGLSALAVADEDRGVTREVRLVEDPADRPAEGLAVLAVDEERAGLAAGLQDLAQDIKSLVRKRHMLP